MDTNMTTESPTSTNDPGFNQTTVYILVTVVGLLLVIIITTATIAGVWYYRRKKRQRNALKYGPQYVHNDLRQNNESPKSRNKLAKPMTKKEAWLEYSNGGMDKLDNLSLDSYRSNLDTITEETSGSNSKSVSNSSSLSDLSKVALETSLQQKVAFLSQSMDSLHKYCETISEMITKSNPQLYTNSNQDDSTPQTSHM